MPAQSAWSGEMIPVLVISLTDSVDRREAISRYLDILKIPFEFVDAIDGRHGLPPEYEDQIDREATINKGRIMADVEFACSLSHMKTYQKIVDENIQWALILEDDAVPLSDLVPFLEGKYYEQSQFTQLISGRPTYVKRTGQRKVFGKYKSYLRSICGKAPLAVGYVISNEVAHHFIKYGIPVDCQADWPECIDTLINDQECRIINPTLIHHPAEGSILDQYGRNLNKEKRRFFGVYVPKFRYILRSYARAPYKIAAIKLHKR